MFSAARVSAARAAAAGKRSFATAVTEAANGVKVAAVEKASSAPTASLTVLVKAGSRFESKEGVANALKNFAFKSTAKRTALGTVRESDLYGGVLSSSLGREHLALSAEFLKGDEAYFLDVLASFITSAKFTRHEFSEYVAPVIESDTAAAAASPAIQAIELAHNIAFRQGLGASLYAPSHPNFGLSDIQDYAHSVFTQGNIAVVGTGIEQAKLAELVSKAFAQASSAAGPTSPASKYFGGENRIAGNGPQTAFIGFGTTGAPSAEAAALAAYLSPAPSVKWSQGVSPIAAALPQGSSVQSVYLPYSDASLVGVLVQGHSAAAVKEAGKVVVDAVKKAAAGASAEEVATAVAKAKFAAASAADARAGIVDAIGAKIFSGSDVSIASALAAFDAVDASAFSKAASSLIASRPTYIAVGDLNALPYADELGL